MKKTLCAAMALLLALALTCTASAADIPKKVLDAAGSAFQIETSDPQYTSTGTGFLISNSEGGAYLITNNHVIDLNVRNVFVWIGDKEKTAAEVVKNDEKYDLALLKLRASIGTGAMLFAKNAERGQSAYAIGFPAAADVLSDSMAHLGKDATITDGVISNIRTLQFVEYGPEISVLQINAALNSGNSGGPLVDKDGYVLGVNTLGVQDAQGIFGSISAADVEAFLSGTGVSLSYAEAQGLPASVWVIIAAAAAAVIAAVLIVIIKKRKRSNKKDAADFRGGLPLETYLERYSGRLNPESVTSLMMTLARALRDRHLQGELHLKLSPKYVAVTAKGCVLDDRRADDGFSRQRFMAPEQLTNELAGVYTDVYSFCAIMDYMLSKAAQADDASPGSAVWRTVIEKGMAADPKERYASMQDLIYALSPFNTGITNDLFTAAPQRRAAASMAADGSDKYSMTMPAAVLAVTEENDEHGTSGAETAAVPKKIKRKKGKAFKACVAAAVVLFVAAAYAAVNYIGARVSISKHDFEAADTYLNLLVFDDRLLQNDRYYVDAGLELQNRNFDAAITAFTALGSVYDSPDLAKEGKYQKAASEADNGNFDAAIALYQELGDYKEAGKLENDTVCRKGYWLIGQKKYSDALVVFESLKDKNYAGFDELIKDANYQCAVSLITDGEFLGAYDFLVAASGYKDANDLMGKLINEIYLEGQRFYHNKDYNNSIPYFTKINGFMRSNDYLTLCDAHVKYLALKVDDNFMDELKLLVGFEDTRDIIVSSREFKLAFLEGIWINGNDYLLVNRNNRIALNKEEYYISKVGLIFQKDGSSSLDIYQIRTKDTIVINQISGGRQTRSYTFYRQ
jgi:outer membrane protein assembly factor BamD (BamD/ComL family)